MDEPLLLRAAARAIDQRLAAAGMHGVLLMENAGRGAADEVAARMRAGGLRRVRVLVGPGNNGGDALVVARHLALRVPGAAITLWSLGDPGALRGDAGVMRDALAAAGLTVSPWPDAPTDDPEVVIDGLFGTGLARPLDDRAAAMVDPRAAPHAALRVALDVPSGLDADTGAPLGEGQRVFQADLTLTFAASKPGLHTGFGVACAGEVRVIDLGVSLTPADLETSVRRSLRAPLGPRGGGAHKGDGGDVVVVGGASGKTGAALLAALGAHRGGAGRVTIASSAPEIDHRVLETMTLPLGVPPFTALADALGQCGAAVVGPGMGLDAKARVTLDVVLGAARCPVVVDADALTLLAHSARHATPEAPWVMTPHPLEMARLLGISGDQAAARVQRDRLGHAREAAKRFHAWVVLKGAGTVLSSPEGDAWILPYAEPTLGVAGSGDVLAGVIAARLAERRAPSRHTAVLEALHAHGRAGELVRAAQGGTRGALAREIADAVPRALEADG